MPSGTRILGRRTVKGCVSETRGAQVACGKPILRWGVGRRGGGPRRLNAGRDFYLQNQSQVYISEVLFLDSWSRGLLAAPPAPPGRHGATFLRPSGAESACRTRTGRPGPRICCVFAVWPGKSGVPPANRTTRTPSGPTKHDRIGTRDCDSSILSAFSPTGTSNPRECRQFRKRHLRIYRKSPARRRAGTPNPRECCEFAKLHLRICRKLPPRTPSVTSIPRNTAL